MVFKLLILIRGLLAILKGYSRQSSFLQKFKKSEPVLKNILQSESGFDDYDLYRMQDYSIRSAVLLGECFAELHCRKLHPEERALMTMLGSFSPFYDDLFDKPVSAHEKKQFIIDLYGIKPENKREKLLYELFIQGYDKVADKKALSKTAYKLHLSQQHSRIQWQESINREEIKKVTFAKGGYSALLFRNLLNEHLSAEEYHFVYLYGAFLQVLDDIFDMLNDSKKGIKTLPKDYFRPLEMMDEVNMVFDQMIHLLKQLRLSRKRRIKVISRIFVLHLAGLCQLTHIYEFRGNKYFTEDVHITQKDMELSWRRFAKLGWKQLRKMELSI